MVKSFLSGTWNFLVDLGRSLGRFVTFRTSMGEFGNELMESVTAVWQEGTSTALTDQRKKARRFLKKGVQCYNGKRYGDALHLFKLALDEDIHYARGYLYFGNTLYKLHEQTEAVEAWKRAIAVEPHSDSAKEARLKLQHLQEKTQLAIDEIQSQLSKK